MIIGLKLFKNHLLTFISHYGEKFYVHTLAQNAGLNEQYFCRFFKKYIGKTPVAYINEYRIGRAIILLQDTQRPVMDICLDCGFHNLGNFLKEFQKKNRKTPLQYRKSFSQTHKSK